MSDVADKQKVNLLQQVGGAPLLSGLLGVAIAAVIAYQTGDAKDYFLVGIWGSLVLAAVFAVRFVVQHWLYAEDATGWLAFVVEIEATAVLD